MEKLLIKGKKELLGKISISGSKNATLPILAAWQGTNDINIYDYIIALLMLVFIITETISDQQQYNFQTYILLKIILLPLI